MKMFLLDANSFYIDVTINQRYTIETIVNEYGIVVTSQYVTLPSGDFKIVDC